MRNTQIFSELDLFIADLYQGRRCQVRPYAYPVSIAALAIGGTIATYTQKINGNADFILVDMCYTMNNISDVLMQITDSASQETLFNTPTPINTIARQYQTQFDTSIGGLRRLAANSNQVITLQNNNQATALDAGVLMLCGVQVFPMSA